MFALGAVTLALSAFIVPDRLYPWINVLSGALVVIVGVAVLTGAGARRTSTSMHTSSTHDHDHEDGHSHGDGHHHHHHEPPQSMRGLVAVGISGGLLPCPSALVVLLAAISLHRVAFGMLLIVAFSFGLALTITGIGLLAVLAKTGVRPLRPERRPDPLPAGGQRSDHRPRRRRDDGPRDP